jgi:hypothetical protein
MHRLWFISPLLAGFLFLAHADSLPPPHALVPLADYARLHSGDLVFRQGRDAVSAAVLATRSASQFSHVGILRVVHGAVWVIHAVPAEADHATGGVKIEPLSQFGRSDRAARLAVVQPFSNLRQGERAALNAQHYVGQPFDADFNLHDDHALYCTELVARAWAPLGLNLATRLEPVQLPFYEGRYLLPQTLYEQLSRSEVATYVM